MPPLDDAEDCRLLLLVIFSALSVGMGLLELFDIVVGVI